jgi:hypothetical protein
MLLLVMLCSMGAWAEKKIVVFSDPHVMNRENVTNDLTLNLPRSLATCDVTMPDQTLEGPNNPFVNISYKFEYANNNFNESSAQDFIAEMGIVVKDGANTMRLGIDYYFGSVELANGNPIGEKSNLGDKCKVELSCMV